MLYSNAYWMSFNKKLTTPDLRFCLQSINLALWLYEENRPGLTWQGEPTHLHVTARVTFIALNQPTRFNSSHKIISLIFYLQYIDKFYRAAVKKRKCSLLLWKLAAVVTKVNCFLLQIALYIQKEVTPYDNTIISYMYIYIFFFFIFIPLKVTLFYLFSF